jgi:hypothetical protein
MKNNPKENLDEWTKGLPDSSYTTTSESNIKFEENKSRITFSNKSKKKCLKINVDGGVYPKGGRNLRCDKLLVEKEKLRFYFVELKGGDIEHAVKQLASSISDPKLNPDCSQDKIAFAVGKNHVPKISTQIQVWKKNFKKSGATLNIEDTPAKYDL